MTLTFKIKAPSGRDETFRRFRLEQPTMKELRTRTARLFDLPENKVWYFRYKDEDGDLVDLSEEEELTELLESQHTAGSSTVRLHVFVESSNGDSSTQQVPFLQLLESLASDLGGTQDPSFCKQWRGPRRGCGGRRKVWQALCDVTDTVLKPGQGWYHQLGTSTDLCEAEFDKLSIEDKGAFARIDSPNDLGEDSDRYMVLIPNPRQHCSNKGKRCQPRPHCGRSRVCGDRPTGCQRPFMAICDATNLPLFPGKGWYHKKGRNFDLCEAAFVQLPKSQQDDFVRVDDAESLGDEAARYGGRVSTTTNRSDDKQTISSQQQLQQNSRSDTTDSPHGWVDVPHSAPEPDRTPGDEPKVAKQAVVVAGPSIAKGASVDAGATVMPVWEVKNTATAHDGVWTDVRVQLREDGEANQQAEVEVVGGTTEVPILTCGESGIVALEVKVSPAAVGRTVRREFELIDGDGNVFGDPLVLEVFVEPAAVDGEQDGVERLVSMGFARNTDTVRVLRLNKGDVNLAALALLRHQ